MPRLSTLLLRASLLALVAGGALGSWLLGAEPWASPWLVRLRAAHIHLMLFGWLVPFVMGTAHWMLPKHAAGPPRGSPLAGGLAAFLVLGGALVGALGALAGAQSMQRLGTLGVIAGAATFIRILWPRVKAFGEGRATSA